MREINLNIRKEIRRELLKNLQFRAVKRGHFVLASGQPSDYYLDCRLVTIQSQCASMIGHILYHMTRRLEIDAIGGPAIGAIPLVTAAVYSYCLAGWAIEGFFIRSAAKEHGTSQHIEGNLKPGSRVVLVDDVLTSGNSLIKTVEAVWEFGCTIEAVICLVDREQGGRSRINQTGVSCHAIFTAEEILQT